MSFYLVQFVEDGLYHVCPQSHVRQNTEVPGLVSAKYKGIFFGAVIVSEGDKNAMQELKERCIINDKIKSKFKFQSPTPSETVTSSSTSTCSSLAALSVKRNLFPENTKACLEERELYNSGDVSTKLHAMTAPGELIEESNIDETSIPHTSVESASEDNQKSYQSEEYGKANVYTDEQSFQNIEEINKKPSTKMYYCPYCRSLYQKFSRHIFQVHGGEKDVAAVSSLEPKNEKRLKLLSTLRAKGSKLYNSLTKSPTNVIIPRRKTTFQMEQYMECYLCGNLYKTKFLHRHVKRCPQADGSSKQAIKTAKLTMLAKQQPEDDDPIKLSLVLSGMREDQVKIAVKNDPLLITFAKFLCKNYGKEIHLINLIRTKLRQLGSVLLAVKDLDDEVVLMEDIFKPTKVRKLFTAINKVTGYYKGTFQKPAMAKDLSTLPQMCAKRHLVHIQEVDDIDREKEEHVKRWIDIIQSDYNAYIGKHARQTLDEHKWNKVKTLPLTEDVFKLNSHVKKITEKAQKSLSKCFSFPEWTALNKATMVQTILFNRKRVGDVQRITFEDFKKAHNIQKGSINFELLSESEKIYASQYKRVEVRGKRGKGVPILMTSAMISNMECILQHRRQAGIPSTNKYLFAQKADHPFTASAVMTEIAYACGAKQPEFSTGTKLRKQIATATQAFNFSTNDLSILAKFLGHTLQTHDEFYRLPDEAVQLSKISVILQAIDSGKVSDLKGKSLQELEELIKKLIEEEETSVENVVLSSETTTTTAVIGDEPQQKKRVKVIKKTWSTPEKVVMRKYFKKTWSTPEKVVMRKYFKTHLSNMTLPTPLECYEAKSKYSPLKCRTVAQIKAWVNNQNVRTKLNK